MEKRLKQLKQELANKVEIAQTNYNVIQKTLSDISKLVQPSATFGSSLLSSTQKDCPEDDWDESSKPKFMNQ